MITQEIILAHSTLSPEVRDVPWVSNCAGEIFLVDADGEDGVRLGHFQGDAALADFVVKAHNAMLPQVDQKKVGHSGDAGSRAADGEGLGTPG